MKDFLGANKENIIGMIRDRRDPIATGRRIAKEVPRRHRWMAGDWFCAAVLVVTVAWLLIEVLPAFFDGRVASAVAR